MYRFLTLNLLLLLSLSLKAQQNKDLRSDTLNFSVQARYLLVSYGAGVEFPFRHHSFGLQAGFNAVPKNGNIYLGFNLDKIGALEYKRYLPLKFEPGKQLYFGGYLLLKNTKYASPEEADWRGDWFRSNSLSLGPLLGYKWYTGQRTYFELFLGAHAGWQWGELRWDNRDPVYGQRDPSYQKAEKVAYGIRPGLSFGFHPFRKDRGNRK